MCVRMKESEPSYLYFDFEDAENIRQAKNSFLEVTFTF